MASRPRPRRTAWLLAPLLLALLWGGWALLTRRPDAAPPAPAPSSATAAPAGSGPLGGRDGVGDPYYPAAGASGYDALRYAIDVAWDPATRTIAGTTTLTARAAQDLGVVHVDLALAVSAATVDGRPAAVAAGPGTDRAVTAPAAIRAGETFTVVLTYSGRPDALVAADGTRPYAEAGDEMLIAGEPEASAAWFPANDHPSDPATYDVRVRVPPGRQALSVGQLVSADEDADPATATWHWALEQPASTYQTFLAVGDFALERGTDGGRPYVYAVSRRLDADARAAGLARLKTTGAVVRALEARYGPYPFGQLGGVLTAVPLPWSGMECASRPVYASAEGLREWVLVHELAHQWFGDRVALASWRDIVDNEGWATFAQWTLDVPGLNTPVDADARLVGQWGTGSTTPLADPGRENLFGAGSYGGGARALLALRNVLGAATFDRLAREWAQSEGPRSLADFRALAERVSGRDLAAFWAAWYESAAPPPKTAAYGYPG